MDLESHSGSATYYLIWLLVASVFLHTAWNLGEIVVLKKILESPLDCKEIKSVNPKWNQPRIFTGRTDAEAEAPILCHLMRRADSLEKTLMLGKIEGRRRGRQRMRWLDGIMASMDIVWANSGRWWRSGKPDMLQTMGLWRVGHDWSDLAHMHVLSF